MPATATSGDEPMRWGREHLAPTGLGVRSPGMDEVTIGEAAEVLGLRPLEIRDLVESGVLRAGFHSSVVRIRWADIETFLSAYPPHPCASA